MLRGAKGDTLRWLIGGGHVEANQRFVNDYGLSFLHGGIWLISRIRRGHVSCAWWLTLVSDLDSGSDIHELLWVWVAIGREFGEFLEGHTIF